jgi:hypothetical protein
MADTVTYDGVAALAAQLSPDERVRLAEALLESAEAVPERPRRKWADLKGKAPYPQCGEDAQAWVSRSRREADEQREAALRGKRDDD